jgi:L-asparaginase
MDRKARIAHLAGPNAAIQNTPPLVTSNKARAKHNLPLLMNPDSTPAWFRPSATMQRSTRWRA